MWLISQSVYDQINAQLPSGAVLPQAAQIQCAAAQSKSGATAIIDVKGVLVESVNPMAAFFGIKQTSYQSIDQALLAADQDDSISDIQLNIDSPGGQAYGMFETVGVIRGMSKPVNAYVAGAYGAQSAAYGLASATDSIIAKNEVTSFGSVGVVADYYTSTDRVSITSTNAPNKRPDVSTDEGQAVVRAELDVMHDLFVESISRGRGISAEKINKDFGQGGSFLAAEAKNRGMIDAIASQQPQPASGGKKLETHSMDLSQLKQEHPAVYAAAVKQGVDQERERVAAHLQMGESSGAMDIAARAINDGSELAGNNKLAAEYASAGMNKQNLQARQGDNPDTGTPEALDVESTAEKDAAAAAKITAMANQLLNVEA